MKRFAMAATLAASLVSTLAFAHDYTVGALKVDHPWARASATKAAKAGGAFMTIHNSGAEGDKLLSASSEVAKRVELHTHTMTGEGVMKMHEVDFVPVPAEGMAKLQPGAYHVMFMGLKAPFVEGQTFPLTLTFAKAGETTVEVKIMGVGHGASGDMGDDGMDHGDMDHDGDHDMN